MNYLWLKKNKRDILALLLLTLFIILIYSPLLFGGKAFFDQEQFGFYYPMSFYVQESLNNNVPLLWNNAYYGGVSASLDQFVGAYYPLNLFLFKNLNFFTAHHLSIFIATTIGTLLAYWFGRSNKWLITSSIVLALSYLLATTFSWLSIGTIAAHSYITFPAMLLAVLKIKENKNFIFYSILGGLGLGIGFLAGFVQIIFYIYPLVLLYALFLDWSKYSKLENIINRFKASVSFIFMSTIGVLIGLKQIMPSVFFIDRTIRTSDYAIQHSFSPGVIEFLTFVLPDYIVRTPFLGGGSHGFYIGVLPIIFAILALVFYRTRSVLFFTGLYLIIIGFAFHLPIFSWLNEHIPPYRNMGGNLRWMVSGALPLAFLGAAGVEGFLRFPEKISGKARKNLLKILGLISLLSILGTYLLNYTLNIIKTNSSVQTFIIDRTFANREMTFPESHYVDTIIHSASRLLDIFSFSNPEFLAPVIFWPLAFLFFFYLKKLDLLKKYSKVVIVTFVLLNVYVVFLFQYDNLLISKEILVEKPSLVEIIESRESDPNKYRIMGFLLGDGLFREVQSKTEISNETLAVLQREFLINNSNLFWDIQRMDGMEPYRTMRHNRLLDTAISSERSSLAFNVEKLHLSEMNQLHNYDVLDPVSLEEKKKDFLTKLPLLSMMNVKYIYSAYELEHEDLEKIFQKVIVVSDDINIYINLYENKKTLPRIYFVKNPIFTNDNDSTILLSLVTNKDFQKETLIECKTCKKNIGKGGNIKIDNYRNGFLELTAVSNGENWLVFSESSMPGWVATVDGEEVPIYDTNYIFQSILIPDGEHKVVFQYKDVLTLKLGKLLDID